MLEIVSLENAPKRLQCEREISVGGTFGSEPASILIENADTRFVPETTIRERTVFAGFGTSTEYRKRYTLCEDFGGEPDYWFHSSGEGWVFDPDDGRIRLAEVHWAEECNSGIHEMRFKGWIDR